jgi:uncharacterized membrane protein (DUF485 family)
VPTSGSKIPELAAARWRIALTLSVVILVLYFGFILLIAYDKPFLATVLTPGLSWGILLGALLIVVSWLLTWFYVSWANKNFAVDSAARKSGAH